MSVKRTVVQPTLRKLREGWGSRCVGNGRDKYRMGGPPAEWNKLESTRQEDGQPAFYPDLSDFQSPKGRSHVQGKRGVRVCKKSFDCQISIARLLALLPL